MFRIHIGSVLGGLLDNDQNSDPGTYKAGSDPNSYFRLDPDPNSYFRLDPDPYVYSEQLPVNIRHVD